MPVDSMQVLPVLKNIATRLRMETGQALPVAVGAIGVLLIAAVALAAIAGALTGAARAQRSADLIAISAG